jgi:hypothetical protein
MKGGIDLWFYYPPFVIKLVSSCGPAMIIMSLIEKEEEEKRVHVRTPT